MILDLKSAFVRICDLFNSDEEHKNWLIYVEEERSRIIIERVSGVGECVEYDVKEEPIFDTPLSDSRELTAYDDGNWLPESEICDATEGDNDEVTAFITQCLHPSENVAAGDLIRDSDDISLLSSKPTTRSSTNKDAKFKLREGKYVCLSCGISFPRSKLARKHVFEGNCDKPRDCTVCSQSFPNTASMLEHMKLQHSSHDGRDIELPGNSENIPMDSIGIQEMESDDSDEAEESFQNPENDDSKAASKEVCLFCGKTLSCSRALKRHVDSKHLGQGKMFACPVCGKDYKCKTKMRDHLQREHPESSQANKAYSCPICGKEFKASLKMKEHLNRIHANASKTCSICNKTFKQIYSLEYHMDIVHSDAPNPFADGESHLCDYCGASFSTKGSLNQHRYTRHVEADKHKERKRKKKVEAAEQRKLGQVKKTNKPKEKREFVCGICGKVFTSHNCMLKQHIAIVHEGKRFPCEICGAEFTTPDKKRVHIGNIHRGIKHKCEYCGKDFTLKDSLKTHINAVHKKIKHRCEICSQEFSIIQDLRQHIKAVHQGIKSKCEYCGKDFNRPQEMKRHQRKVHQDQMIMNVVGPKIEIPIATQHVILTASADGQTITQTITSL